MIVAGLYTDRPDGGGLGEQKLRGEAANYAKPGNGFLLFFRVDDFNVALSNAHSLVSRLDEAPHMNPNTRIMKFSLRDPDGYYVSISALDPA